MDKDKLPVPEPDEIEVEAPDGFPPPERSGTLAVGLEYIGHTKPLPDPCLADDFVDLEGNDRPPIRSGTLPVTLRYAGQSKPMLPDDPKDYDAPEKASNDAWRVLQSLIGTVEAPPDWAQNHDDYLNRGK